MDKNKELQIKKQNRIVKKLEPQLNIRFLFIAAILILLLAGMSIFSKREEYSKKEGRNLNVLPFASADSVIDGSFTSDIDAYVSDSIAFRDMWLEVRNFSRSILGSKDSGGIYKCSNGYLIEKFNDPGKEKAEEIAETVSEWGMGTNKPDIYMTAVPTSGYVFSDKLPYGADAGDQETFLTDLKEAFSATDVNYIDISSTLRTHKDEEIYFKSDSNWTSLGAYYAYRFIGQEMELDMSTDNFEAMKVSESFVGDLAAKSGLSCGQDDINIYFPLDSSFKQVVEYDGVSSSVSPYVSSALKSNCKRNVFFGGAHSFIRINTSSVSKKTLLVIKDSYGDNFIPFLMVNYREILVVDPELYYGDLNELMASQIIDDVLILGSTKSLAGNDALINLLKGE